jgi:hypothetical protein
VTAPGYDPALDQARLTKQLERVFDLMRDGRWRTLQEIADATGDPHASIRAQLAASLQSTVRQLSGQQTATRSGSRGNVGVPRFGGVSVV